VNPELAISPTGVPALSRQEQSLNGTRISPGLAMGTAWVAGDILECSGQAVRIGSEQIEAEMLRIRRAVLEVEAELEESARLISEQLDPRLAEIFHAHQMMLDSFLSSGKFETELQESLVAAPEAVRQVFRRWEAKFAALKSEAFRVRADDILDLARRILRRLEGHGAYGLAAMPTSSVPVQ
jgi:phosphotransferase system enzyme I (PtsI)